MSGAKVEIRPLRAADEASVLGTFREVFGAARTPAEWRWAFLRNPAGTRAWVAVEGDRVVAQYAALPSRVWTGGEDRVFAQIVDSMSHPDRRGAGLFVRTAEAFFDAHGGPDRDLVHFGWPVERAWRLGRRKLRYEAVRTQVALARELEPGPDAVPAGVEVLAEVDEQARWLYDRCVGAWGASTVRDAEWLRWRYLEHPTHRYVLLGARDAAGVLRGLAVYRRASFGLPDLGVLVDWLVPPEEPEVGELLRAAAAARARADGAPALVAWLPEWSPWFDRFQRDGFRVHPTDYLTVARNFHPRYRMEWLRAHWWYQPGDSDLV